jgi:hypothetical protein
MCIVFFVFEKVHLLLNCETVGCLILKKAGWPNLSALASVSNESVSFLKIPYLIPYS